MSDDACADSEEEPWNSLVISAFPSASFVGAEVVDEDVASVPGSGVTFEDVEASQAGSFKDPAVKREPRCLPFTWVRIPRTLYFRF